MLRTHTAGALRAAHADENVTLCGWVDRVRDIGQLTFLSLRDRYGVTQCVFDAHVSEAGIHEQIKTLHLEDCVKILGKVRKRSEKDVNSEMATGDIEVLISGMEVLNESAELPFQVKDDAQMSDELRLKYRYLDLRRPRMQKNLELRHKVVQAVRDSLCEQGFLEIETPLLIRSTPEGARDFVVPSRLNKGSFYALPQSPQLYKQMLMVSGCDRYFQFAPAFRDEDLRADRVPVHTQIDMEMSFVEEKDVFSSVEAYVERVFKQVKGIELKGPFPAMTYKDVMERYGIDKPDIRFGLELQTVTEWAKTTDFAVFQQAECVRCLVVPGGASFSRKDIEALESIAKTHGAKGLAWCKASGVESDGTLSFSGGVSKFVKAAPESVKGAVEKLEQGDLLLFVADRFATCCAALAHVRLNLGERLGLIDHSRFAFVWVNEFPMFEWDEDRGAYNAMHHLFTQPMREDIQWLDEDPGKVRGYLYDLVLNGWELISGSLRINEPAMQQKVLDIVKMSREEAESKFGFLMNAFKYGAPPHGGSAMGLDRFVALLAGERSIREVMAYPPNNTGVFPLDGAPAPIDQRQLEELGLEVSTSSDSPE